MRSSRTFRWREGRGREGRAEAKAEGVMGVLEDDIVVVVE